MANYRLVLAYDGTDYRGWQRQPDLPTVQGALEEALAEVASLESPLYAAGRTDAGVHARGQVVNFHGAIKPRPERLPAALNAFLPHDIVVMKCEEVAEDFNARRSAVAREYRYFIHRGEFPWPFNRRYAHHYPGYLNEQAMEEALARIRGVHDFAAFARCEEGKTGVREVLEAEMRREEETLQIRVKANAFVWMMMRMLCGSLLEVGRGKWTAEHFAEVLDGRDNSASGPALPPRGLFLEEVYY
ncbi:MAG: tRNA pseudouridine(38-40) synthase TruA [Actinomycetota bacterium]|nr:tRNA pseudouridine(38-40) synthase TruA [Actinomycetota bacterium]MDD5667818.1 tRNA pseudouridine(38-40) synthase TruA [Actinomycetota bacterium]